MLRIRPEIHADIPAITQLNDLACGIPRSPHPFPDEAFLARALIPGGLDDCAGLVEYPPAFAEV